MPKNQTAETPIWIIAQLAGDLGIENPHELHLRVGGISYPRMVKVWKGVARLDAGELERFAHLFNCPVGDLISTGRRLSRT